MIPGSSNLITDHLELDLNTLQALTNSLTQQCCNSNGDNSFTGGLGGISFPAHSVIYCQC